MGSNLQGPTDMQVQVEPDRLSSGKVARATVANIRRTCYHRFAVARRPDPENPDVLSEDEVKQLRHSLAHLSPDGVRQFYERAFGDCRLVYDRLPSPRKIQTLVQVWKQLWKWR
jgi:hypothetical protein